MPTWTKPNGNIIETNDRRETIAYCKSLGWLREVVSGPEITAEDVNKMRKAGLKKLAKERRIEIDDSLSVTDMRCVVVAALFKG